MGLASEMKNLTEELLTSFKNRIKENEELISNVQTTLDGFRKDHQGMTAVLNTKAAILREDLAKAEKVRLSEYKSMMKGIHASLNGIRTNVTNIKNYTDEMVNDFLQDRKHALAEWEKMQEIMTQIRQEDHSAKPK